MKARATVIIPTFGNAKFALWAVRSVQQQTVKEIEICIICDGSPENMVAFFRSMEKDDPRITVFAYPKSPRTGEPYRDDVIRRTSGEIICYCCHDDLWLPYHLEEMEKSLAKCQFTHSFPNFVSLPEDVRDVSTLFGKIIYWKNLNNQRTIRRMCGGKNYFGLTFGAHTRGSYYGLTEGWVTTPRPEVATDSYMWCKFVAAFGTNCSTVTRITALRFPQTSRKDWSEQKRDDELKLYFEKIQDPAFLRDIDLVVHRLGPSFFYRAKRKIRKKILKWFRKFGASEG
jgi:glycosyltransferase involved in cell wall biosynthesis